MNDYMRGAIASKQYDECVRLLKRHSYDANGHVTQLIESILNADPDHIQLVMLNVLNREKKLIDTA